jgi:urease accessory protein
MGIDSSLYRLMTWMSPSFPVGAYSFSHGLENAVESGLVCDMETARNWIADLASFGGGQSDLVFLAAAWQAANNEDRLRDVHELALAFQPTLEIQLETTAQGTAFVKTIAATWPCAAIDSLGAVTDGAIVFPVAVGAIARGHNIEQEAVIEAYGHAFIANLVSAAVRLIPLGQTDGQRITASLLAHVTSAATKACDTPLDGVTNSCIMADITSMQHEVQYTRLFRS